MREVARGAIVRLLNGQGVACADAVVIQSAAFSALPSVLICPVTYEEVDAPLLRIAVSDGPGSGLPGRAWAMVELLSVRPRTS